MKRKSKLLAIFLSLAIGNLVFANLVFAASPSARHAETTIVVKTKSSESASDFQAQGRNQGELKFSQKELEQFRADLINFVQAYRDLAASLGMEKQAETFEKAAEQFRQLPLNQLDALRNGLSDTSRLAVSAKRLHDQIELQRSSNNLGAPSFRTKSANNFAIESAGFPVADYPTCNGGTRVSDSVMDAADDTFFAAETVRDVASRICDEVVVIAGEGGNGSLACEITDATYLAAKVINFALHQCNDKFDGAESEATYLRLGHIHSDLESSVANDNSNKTAIINNDNSNKTAIIDNANANLTTITTSISTAKTEIINNDNANKNAIIANDNANATMLRDLILRTQIEADLASTDGSAFVALYLTPGVKGGYLELVRSIVVQTISNIGGANTGQANALLAKGDAYKTAGDYRAAYTNYRQAYKKAQGL
jgi:tetratricopeptide (TPR) repeat protein